MYMHHFNSHGFPASVRKSPFFLILFTLGRLASGGLFAADVAVLNPSFELPETEFAGPVIDAWTETPVPVWYDEEQNGPWSQLTGVFKNPASGEDGHKINVDGNQALFLFALPEVGITQELSGDQPALFEAGRAYRLTVGVTGGGGGMLEGTSLELRLFHRNTENETVTIAATEIVHSNELFPTTAEFTDFEVVVPAVNATDAWAGKSIGVGLISTVSPELVTQGYWDIDHVRLTSTLAPVVSNPGLGEGGFEFTIAGEPGTTVEVLVSGDASAPVDTWTLLDTVENPTGTLHFDDETEAAGDRFYLLREVSN